MKLKLILLVLLIPCSLATYAANTGQQVAKKAPPKCNYGEPSANAPEEFDQFAFLIGDYSVEPDGWHQGKWYSGQVPIAARWNGYYGLDGQTIIDEWFTLDPGIDPTTDRGINVRLYDDASKEWKMMWMSSSKKIVQDLRAKLIDGKLTMWQVTPERPNFKAVFEVVDSDHWHRIQYDKQDDGSWLPKYKLNATRIPCP